MAETPVNFQPIKYITEAGLSSALGSGQAGRRDNVIVDSPFLGVASKDFVDTVAANEDAFNATVQDYYNSLSPYVGKAYSRQSAFVTGLGLIPETIAGAQKGGANIAITLAPSLKNAFNERIAKRKFYSWVGDNASKEDVLAVENAVNAFAEAGYTEDDIININPDLAEVDAKTGLRLDPNSPFSGKTKKVAELSSSQKEILKKWQEMKSWEKKDEAYRKTKEIFGEELSGKLYLGGIVDPLEYRDSKEYQQEGISVGAEAVGQIAAEVLATGGTAIPAAGLRAGGMAVARLAGKQAAKEALKRYIGKRGIYEAAFVGKAVSARVGAAVAKRWGSKLGTIAAIGGKGAFFSNSFLRGYDSGRTYALSKGASYDDANAIGMQTGTLMAATEGLAFDSFLNKAIKSEGFLTTYFNNMVLPEAVQEASQTLGEQIINVAHGLDEFDMRNILTETLVAGVLGGIGGAMYSFGPGFTKRVHALMKERLKTDAMINKFVDAIKESKKIREQKTTTQSDTKTDASEDTSNQAATESETEQNKKVKALPEEVVKEFDGLEDDNAIREEVKEKIAAWEARQEKKKSSPEANVKEETADDAFAKAYLNMVEEEAKKEAETSEKEIAAESIKAKQDEDAAISKAIDEEVSPVPEPIEETETAEEKALTDGDLRDENIFPIAGTTDSKFAAAEAKLQAFYNRLHLSRNKAATEEELLAGWNLVKKAIYAEANGDIHVVDLIDAYVDGMFNNINSQNEWIKSNSEHLKKKFGELLTPELRAALTSTDPAKRVEAQFKLVDAQIKKMFKDAGHEKTGIFVANLFKRMYYDVAAYGLANPLEIFSKMTPIIVDMSRARLNGQLNREAFASVFDSFRYESRDTSPSEMAARIAAIHEKMELLYHGLFESEDPKKEEEELIRDITSFFIDPKYPEFGEHLASREKVLELYDLLKERADQERIILQNIDGAQEFVANLHEDNYLMMAIMREFGYSQKQIISALNAKDLKGVPVTERQYQEGLQRAFPKLNKSELKALERLERASLGLDHDHSAFVPKENIITKGLEQRHGELVHESIHWLITNALLREAEIMSKGLPGGNPRLRALLEAYMKKYPRLGELTGEKFQETIIEGLMDSLEIQNIDLVPEKKKNYVYKRTSTDKELADLFYEVMKEVDYVKRSPKGSIYSSFTKKQSVQKEFLTQTLGLFSKSHTQVMFESLSNLRHKMNYGTKKEMLEEANKFLTANNAVIPSAETFQLLVDAMKKEAVSVFQAKEALEDVVQATQISLLEREVSFAIEANQMEDKKGQKQSNALRQLMYDQNILRDNVLHFAPTYDGTIVAPRRVGMLSDRLRVPERLKALAINHIKNPSLILETIGDLWHSLTTTVYKDSQALGNELYNIIYNASKADKARKARDQKHIFGLHDIFVKHSEVISDRAFDSFQLILFNGDKVNQYGKVIFDARKEAIKWLETHIPEQDRAAAIEHFNNILEMLKVYPKELAKHGIDLDKYVSGFYWPRHMTNADAYARSKGYNSSLSGTTKLKKQGIEDGLSAEDFINSLSSIGIKNANDPNQMTILMRRTNTSISRGELPFYADIFSAALKYSETNSQTIFQRTLFGKVQKGPDGQISGFDRDGNPTTDFHEILMAQDGQVGIWLNKYFQDVKKKKQLPDEKALKYLESSLYAMTQKGSKKNVLFDTAITASTFVNLTQLVNTVNQLGELQVTGTRFTPENAKQALQDVLKGHPSVVTLKDINSEETEVDRLVEADALSLLKIGIKRAQKLTGMLTVDAAMKETSMRAGILEARDAIMLQERMDKGEKLTDREKARIKEVNTLLYRFAAIDDINAELKVKDSKKIAKLEKLKADILADKKTQDVMDFSEQILTDTQPIDLTSRLSLMNGGGVLVRGALLFKSVGIRQIDWIAGYIKRGFKISAAEGSRRVAAFIVLGLLVGLPKNALVDIIDGKKPEAHFFDSIAGPLFLNEYVIAAARKEGLGSAIKSTMEQPFSFLDGPSKDVYDALHLKMPKFHSIKGAPVVGRFVYNWFLEGYYKNKKEGRTIL